MISAFGVDHGPVHKGVLGRVRVTRAANVMANDRTPVMLKLPRSSRRGVPVSDGNRPEHFLGGQFKVTRTRQRNGITVHTVKQVKS